MWRTGGPKTCRTPRECGQTLPRLLARGGPPGMWAERVPTPTPRSSHRPHQLHTIWSHFLYVGSTIQGSRALYRNTVPPCSRHRIRQLTSSGCFRCAKAGNVKVNLKTETLRANKKKKKPEDGLSARLALCGGCRFRRLEKFVRVMGHLRLLADAQARRAPCKHGEDGTAQHARPRGPGSAGTWLEPFHVTAVTKPRTRPEPRLPGTGRPGPPGRERRASLQRPGCGRLTAGV